MEFNRNDPETTDDPRNGESCVLISYSFWSAYSRICLFAEYHSCFSQCKIKMPGNAWVILRSLSWTGWLFVKLYFTAASLSLLLYVYKFVHN